MQRKHLALLFCASTFSLSTLSACPTPNISSSPDITTPPKKQTALASSAPLVESKNMTEDISSLTLNIQGVDALQNFVTQQTQGICLNELTSLQTVLILPNKPDLATISQLEKMGVTFQGNNLIITSPVKDIPTLIKGIELKLPNLPLGKIMANTDLNNASGQSMGSIGFSFEYKAESNSVQILLKPAGSEPNPKGCIPIIPEVEGATLIATAGGLLVELPPTENTETIETETPDSIKDNLPTGLASLALDVSNRFITALGETRQLKVKLFDDEGKELSPNEVIIEWSSSRPQDLSVDSQGKIEALVGLGFSKVTAKVSGTEFSDSVLFDVTNPSFFSSTSRSSNNQTLPEPTPEPTFAPPVPEGLEFQVNSYTSSRQRYPSVAIDDDGDFVAVWESFGSNGTDTNRYSIQGQRYHSDGSTDGSQFQINTYTTSSQRLPSIAIDNDGDFIVTWSSYGSNDTDSERYSIQGQRYFNDGSTDGSQFQINTYTTDNQKDSAIAFDDEGDFVVVWMSYGSNDTDTERYSIQGQRYHSDGSTDGSQFQINTYTTDQQQFPSVAIDSEGDFVVVWQSAGSSGTDSDSGSIQGQSYQSDGSTKDSEFQINTITDSGQKSPSVVMDGDGDFIVVWSSFYSNGSDDYYTYSIQGRRYDSNGSVDDSEFQINTYTTGDQGAPTIAMDDSGNYVVMWQSRGSSGTDSDSYSIRGQRYHSDGSVNGSELQVNTYTTSHQITPSIALDNAGDFVVIWSSYGSSETDTEDDSIQGQRYR